MRTALLWENPTTPMPQGRLQSGRREINWDGGGGDATTAPVTPFNVFLNTGAVSSPRSGVGLSQAPPSGGATGWP